MNHSEQTKKKMKHFKTDGPLFVVCRKSNQLVGKGFVLFFNYWKILKINCSFNGIINPHLIELMWDK